MNKIQQFLFSTDYDGNKYIIKTREPMAIFYQEKLTGKFELLTSCGPTSDSEKMEGLTKRVNDWYIYTILNKPVNRK